MNSSVEEFDRHIQLLEQEESLGIFSAQSIIEHKIEKTKKAKLDLKEGQHFNISIFEKLKRKNIVYHGLFSQKVPIDIKSTRGTIVIPIVDSEQIAARIGKIKNKEDRNKIGYIRIATIQVLIKSTFKEGIDSPIALIAYDRRIKDIQDSVLGLTMGNLAYKTLKL